MPARELRVAIPEPQADRLDRLAQELDRSSSSLAAEAIEAFLKLREWQTAEIRAALDEADAYDFASDDEIANVVRRYCTAE